MQNSHECSQYARASEWPAGDFPFRPRISEGSFSHRENLLACHLLWFEHALAPLLMLSLFRNDAVDLSDDLRVLPRLLPMRRELHRRQVVPFVRPVMCVEHHVIELK